MASFPTSVKVFTSKNDGPGNNINAAHVNDLQDEVNAIEAGYLNGTARLNAAGSTLTSLSVTGNSTLAAVQGGASTFTTLQVTGNSSFATRPIFTPPDAALVFLESSGAMGSSGISTLAFTAEDFVTNSSVHSTGTNPERLTPQSTGVYLFVAQIGLGGNLTGASSLSVILRDSSNNIFGRQDFVGAGAPRINATAMKRFDALGGWAVATLSNNGGGSTISFSTGAAASWFSMVKL